LCRADGMVMGVPSASTLPAGATRRALARAALRPQPTTALAASVPPQHSCRLPSAPAVAATAWQWNSLPSFQERRLRGLLQRRRPWAWPKGHSWPLIACLHTVSLRSVVVVLAAAAAASEGRCSGTQPQPGRKWRHPCRLVAIAAASPPCSRSGWRQHQSRRCRRLPQRRRGAGPVWGPGRPRSRET
jgi:hypothetical protein